MPKAEQFKALPAPWDRIFSLGTRLFVWGLLIGILYILRPFFLLIFLTFVFGYVQAHMSEGLDHRIKNRPSRVVLVFLIFLGAIIGTGYFIGPRLKEQAETFLAKYPAYMKQGDETIYQLADRYEWVNRLVTGKDKEKEEAKRKAAEEARKKKAGETEDPNASKVETPPPSEAATPKDQEPKEQGPKERPEILAPTINHALGMDDTKKVIVLLQETLATVFGIGSAFLLSLLFSFLIVLDLPKLSRGVAGLQHTRAGFIYDEVAENMLNFGKVLGRALEAQLFIAIINTILTGIGIYFMGLPNLVFLCTVVFFCSFIPVAGVFLSSAPICLLALQEQGIQLMLIAIALILLIHFIEAYFLNPQIFGHHMHMNAVLVLIVLTVAGKLFGVWGLVLGLPITNYIFGHAIRYRDRDDPLEPAGILGGDAIADPTESLEAERSEDAQVRMKR